MLRPVAAADRARSCASNVPRYIEPSSARPVFGSSPISEARTVKRGCLGGASSHKAISSIIASESPLAASHVGPAKRQFRGSWRRPIAPEGAATRHTHSPASMTAAINLCLPAD